MPVTLTPGGPTPPPEPGTTPRKSPVNPAKEPRETKAKSPVSLATEKEIRTWLAKMYATVGVFLMPVKPVVANQILISSEKCADSVAKLAMEDIRIRRAISAAMVTGIWGAVIIAHLPILFAVLSEVVSDDPEARLNKDLLLGMAQFVSGQDDDSVGESDAA